jgi:hypothetical protein
MEKFRSFWLSTAENARFAATWPNGHALTGIMHQLQRQASQPHFRVGPLLEKTSILRLRLEKVYDLRLECASHTSMGPTYLSFFSIRTVSRLFVNQNIELVAFSFRYMTRVRDQPF